MVYEIDEIHELITHPEKYLQGPTMARGYGMFFGTIRDLELMDVFDEVRNAGLLDTDGPRRWPRAGAADGTTKGPGASGKARSRI